MKSFLVFCILFAAGISAKKEVECDFDNKQLKEAHRDYFKNANRWDFATYKDELKKLNAQFEEYRNSLDPKCFEGTVGAGAKIMIDMFTNKFDFLGTITENQKNVIYNPDYFKCLKKHGNEVKTCVTAERFSKFCEEETETVFMNCWKTMLKDRCNIATFEDFLNFGKYVFKYSKEKNLCGQNHVFLALMKTAVAGHVCRLEDAKRFHLCPF